MSIPLIQRNLWELLACGQSLAESQHWFSGEHIVLYEPTRNRIGELDPRMKSKIKEYRKIETMIKPMLLSAARQSGSKYFAAASLILGHDQRSSGTKHKVTELVAMNDYEHGLEQKAALYWESVINKLEESILKLKETSNWDRSSKYQCFKLVSSRCAYFHSPRETPV